ncbi:MAG: Omp28-related outer membrane protein [Odoribacter sp.]
MKDLLKITVILLCSYLFVACSSSDDSAGLVLKNSKNTIKNTNTDSVVFTVMYGDMDVTAQSKIMVNGKETLKGNYFATDKAGDYVFTARYDAFTSNDVRVKVTLANEFVKKALVQQFTGTGCIWCPQVNEALQTCFVAEPTRIVCLAFHNSYIDFADPFYFEEIDKVAAFNELSARELPLAQIDYDYGFVASDKVSRFDISLNKVGDVGVAITSTLSGRDLSVTVKSKCISNFTDPLLFGVYLTEDKLIARQKKGDPLDLAADIVIVEDYEHNNVVRHNLSKLVGDLIPADKCQKGMEYQQVYSFTIPAGYKIENMHIVAYVFREYTRNIGGKEQDWKEVRNVQKAKLNVDAPYEYAD